MRSNLPRSTSCAQTLTLSLPAAALQARSDELADKAMRKVDLIRQTRDLDAYKRFCMAANVPPYPVTDAMVALVVFARASQESGPIQTFRDNLARTKRATDFVWTAIEGIKNSVSVEADVNALKAFVRERTSKAAKCASLSSLTLLLSTLADSSPRSASSVSPASGTMAPLGTEQEAPAADFEFIRYLVRHLV